MDGECSRVSCRGCKKAHHSFAEPADSWLGAVSRAESVFLPSERLGCVLYSLKLEIVQN